MGWLADESVSYVWHLPSTIVLHNLSSSSSSFGLVWSSSSAHTSGIVAGGGDGACGDGDGVGGDEVSGDEVSGAAASVVGGVEIIDGNGEHASDGSGASVLLRL